MSGAGFPVRIRVILCCLENLRERVAVLPVPQTDTGG